MTRMTALSSIQLEEYSQNVKIFEHTMAIEVPDRLDAITNSFKEYQSSSFGTMVDHLNQSITKVSNYIENVVYQDIVSFKDDIQNGIGNYVGSGAAYSVDQTNELFFTGSTSYSTDFNNRIVSMTDGNKSTYDILYDVKDRIVSFKEKITVSGVEYVNSYTVDYDGIFPQITKE